MIIFVFVFLIGVTYTTLTDKPVPVKTSKEIAEADRRDRIVPERR